ncbi:hypothetical protein SELMODRAFT_126010 [Selaginella moellendorffii]|uniref:DNA topoisomerase (ATP-hydrolyzing) n=1 Tax=Selaginella moellendorffii TaxID=88036 RepID=D8SVR4_SELML|nr:hypothetical protein SELMODRAFT_126010 [Selaginella moellendorffii]
MERKAAATGDGGAAVAVHNDRTLLVELHKEASESYLSYAMSVIVGRALPDVRDGLKPVHRRILYAMNELGLASKKPHRKCARVVGEVLGKFHPHGDTAVYDALVRLAQASYTLFFSSFISFSLRSPLISGHGNFGSLDGDPAAAMRYTECRLHPLSEAMLLADLDLDTVDFIPNFDGSQKEPVVMPARLPNVLINGASGIAVGMATNIPPHNLSEVVDALCALIKNPNATVEELMEHLPGPDFPTGGQILGISGIADAFRTGRGTITVRGKADFEELEGKISRSAIIITEIPYGTNKSTLVAKIAELVNSKTLEGVSDIRDESDRAGMRIVVELKRGAVAAVVLNNLYKHTALQSRFSYNLVGILNKEPEVFSIKRLLEIFLDFRCSVVQRRAQCELTRAEARDHLLEGFLKGLDKLDDVVKVLKSAKDSASAMQALQKDFELSAAQAEALLGMPLRRITSLERNKILEEHNSLLAQASNLRELLSNKQRVLRVVEKEALALKNEFGSPRRTVLEEDGDGRIDNIDVIPNNESFLTLSEKGYIKRMQPDTFLAQRRGTTGKSGAKMKSNDGMVDSFMCRNHDHVLVFSERGVVYSFRAYQVPECSRTSAGVPIIQVLSIPAGERITSIFPLSEFREDHFLVMLTSKGYIKRTELPAFSSIRPQGIVAIQLMEGDELKWVRLATQSDRIFIGSRNGMAMQAPCEFRSMRRGARGLRAMRIKEGDEIAAIDIVPGSVWKESPTLLCTHVLCKRSKASEAPWLLFVSENGMAKRVPITSFPRHGLNKVGVIGCKFVPGDRLASMFVVGTSVSDGESNEEIVVGTQGGIFNRFKVREISIKSRMGRGIKLMKLDVDDKVKSVSVVAASDSPAHDEPPSDSSQES